jgi:hypothetical protein
MEVLRRASLPFVLKKRDLSEVVILFSICFSFQILLCDFHLGLHLLNSPCPCTLIYKGTLQRKSHLCIHFWELCGPSPNLHIHVSVRDLHIPRIGPHIFLQQNRQDQSWKYINLSQIYERKNWETEHYNSVLKITVSFLGIHKGEPDIYIHRGR